MPKDVCQAAELLKEDGVLVKAINRSNENRKRYVVAILCNIGSTIGFYRLQTKRESNNIRYSAMIDILQEITKEVKMFIYMNRYLRVRVKIMMLFL